MEIVRIMNNEEIMGCVFTKYNTEKTIVRYGKSNREIRIMERNDMEQS
jgi:hypothetical protein